MNCILETAIYKKLIYERLIYLVGFKINNFPIFYFTSNSNGITANFAVFYIRLRLFRRVNQNRNLLKAVRTGKCVFDLHKKNSPISREKIGGISAASKIIIPYHQLYQASVQHSLRSPRSILQRTVSRV